MNIEIIEIETEYITLGQFLKHTNIISTGGMAKPFLQEYLVYINDDKYAEERRGKKLRHGDLIDVEEFGVYQIKSTVEGD